MVKLSNAEFAGQVNEFTTNYKWSKNALAKAAGVSSSAVSQLLADKYMGDVAAIRAKIAGVIAREREKSASPKNDKGFILTSVSARAFDVAKNCHIFGEIGVCYSAAGLGKTESMREYARQNPDVVLIEADPGYTAKVLFSELRDIVGGTSRANLC